jgi:hypothetical protein
MASIFSNGILESLGLPYLGCQLFDNATLLNFSKKFNSNIFSKFNFIYLRL